MCHVPEGYGGGVSMTKGFLPFASLRL